MPESLQATASRIESLLGPLPAPTVLANSAPAKPAPEPEPEPVAPVVGDSELIEGRVRMVLVEVTPDNRNKWALYDAYDLGRGALEYWYGADVARARAKRLLEKLPKPWPEPTGVDA